MTTLYREIVKCAVCKTDNECIQIGSTNQFGAVDLDTRPPEMARRTLYENIFRCRNCGYCSSNIRTAPKKINSLLELPEYTQQLNNAEYPETANHFLCSAIVHSGTKKIENALWCCLQAAWVCDDAGNNNAAINCRKLVINYFNRLDKKKKYLFDRINEHYLIKIDVMRRAGLFEDALGVIANAENIITEEFLSLVVQFQKKLCLANDDKCYTAASVTPAD